MIRPYEARDLADVLAVWYAASLVGHPFLDETFLAQERQNIVTHYLPNAETWVYEIEGRTVGFISLVGDEVGGLFVAPTWHGQGIGRALMDRAQALRGRLAVEVFEANRIGRRFYERYGFVLVDRYLHEATSQMALRLLFDGGDE